MRDLLAAALLSLASAGPALAGAQQGGIAPADGAAGSELSVYLLTMGQGDLVWERYGHNAIGIRDARAGTDVVYNWGMFSFSQPGFLRRFIRGDMLYWMAPFDGAATVAEYMALNRTVTVQELNLSPAQRLALLDYLQWNAREENRHYRYDYFRDNCSTRVRDALDRILGGALRMATAHDTTAFTYRSHALRLMAEDPLLSTGIDIGLGRPTDRPITAWEEMFIPMRVRDHVRALRVPDETGAMVPLVTEERVVFEASRPPERGDPPLRWPLHGGLGAAIAGFLWWLGLRARAGRRRDRLVAWSASVAWCALAGTLGVALAYLQLATSHVAAHDNTNIFLLTPHWLLLALVAPLAGVRADLVRGARLAAGAALAVTIAGAAATVLPSFHQANLAVTLLFVPPLFAAAFVMRRLVRDAHPAPA